MKVETSRVKRSRRGSASVAGLILGLGITGLPWMGVPARADSLDDAPRSGSEGGEALEAPVVRLEIWPALTSPMPVDPEVERAVGELMERMSLKQKVGQVIQAEIRHVKPADVKKYYLGSVLNGGGSFPGDEKYSTPGDWLALADAFYKASMAGNREIPVIWGVDAVHGHNNVIGATLFPHNIGLGAARNPELIREIGRVTATEVAATGLDWDFGPTVAVPRDDRWGRTYEGYSEDPEIVHAYAREMVIGLQGEVGADDFLSGERVLSTAKHFLGDGGTVRGIDQGDNRASEEDLMAIHGAGYVSALEAGVQVVMASFNSWHGRKLHGQKELLTDVLKGRMGFDGFVVGDWNGHGQVKGCTNDDCAASLNAGVDMFMVPEDWKALFKNTLEQVKDGTIPMERLDDAVRRILRVKMRAGLFERGKPSSRPLAGKAELIGAPAHRELGRRAVRESLVLLKNATVDGEGLLPLRRDQNVLVAGDGADNIGKQSGGWTISWQGTGNSNDDFPGATSIWGGIREAVEAGGGTATLSVDGSFDGAFDGTAKPDVAVVVFGEDPYAEFQGDRENLIYQAGSASDLALLKRLQEAEIPVVSVFLSGRPMWVNPEINASDAFVAAWLPGTEGGGVADVLFRDAGGDVHHDFRGRLSFSWPRSPDQVILNRLDSDYDPLFPYGFGLTYESRGDLAELSEEIPASALAGSSKIYYASGPIDPWALYLKSGDLDDGASDRVVMTGAAVSTAAAELTVRPVDRVVQEDSRAATWNGSGRASLALSGNKPVDISRESNGNLSLAIALYLDEAPSGEVTFEMGCGEDCAGSVDLTETLKGLPVGEWITLRLRLRCFADAGTDMTQIETPLRITTAGKLALRFSDVRLASAADGEGICPQQ